MKLEPLGNYVIAEVPDIDKKEYSGILLPDHVREGLKSQESPYRIRKIVAVGQGCLFLKVDDFIVYEHHVPTIFKFEEKEYELLKEEYVTARIKMEPVKAEA